MTALLIAALVLPWILVSFQAWLLYQLVRRHGAQLLAMEKLDDRLDAVEQALVMDATEASFPPPLPVGSPAPRFGLPDLDGNERRLEEFLGVPLLVTFFDLRCGFCRSMAPELGALSERDPRVLLISRGDADDHRRLAEEHGWRCDVVLDQDRDILHAYQTHATPTAYLLDAEGRIASERALGVDNVLALATSRTAASNGPTSDLKRHTSERGRFGRGDLRRSRLNRSGLPVGTPAPDFTLPDLDGELRSLADLRGRRVLLVFSDADCTPCDALAPKLVELRRKHRGDVEILLVSRGGREANGRKASEHGYEFPVVLQRSWEVSKQYAMFTTPVAYLIDERGVVSREVAVGQAAIVSLLDVLATA